MDKTRFTSASDLAWLAHRTLRGVNAVVLGGSSSRVHDQMIVNFEQAERNQTATKMRIFYVVALIVIGLNCLVDLFSSDQLPYLILTAKSLTAVIMVALLALTFNPSFERFHTISMTTAVAALSLCWLYGSVSLIDGQPRLSEYSVILLAMTFLGMLATPFRWVYQALVLTSMMLLAGLYWLRFESLAIAQITFCVGIVLGCGALSMLCGYGCFRLRRQQFFQLYEVSALVKSSTVVASHRRLVTIDPLTCVANRHSLDRMLKKEWQELRKRGSVISLLVLQVQQKADLVRMASGLLHLTGTSASCVARFDQCSLAILWMDPQTQPTQIWLQQLHQYLTRVTDQPQQNLVSMTSLKPYLGSSVAELYRRALNSLQPVT